MIEKKLQRKMMFFMIFMYFVAPQIWGIWMVLKLNIITFHQYLHLATSPLTILILVLFFYVNKSYYLGVINKIKTNNLKEISTTPIFHLISIILFGTVGTFLAMLTLYFPKLNILSGVQPIESFKTVITGMLAGASLTLTFFFLFTSMIIHSIETMSINYKVTATRSLFYKYLPWNIAIVITGLFLLVFSTVKAVSITSNGLNTYDFIEKVNFNILTLLVPIAMGTFLLIKQVNFHKPKNTNN